MKKIRYLKGNALLVKYWTISKEGIVATDAMLNDSKIQELISKGVLEVFEELPSPVSSSQSESISEPSLTTSSSQTQETTVVEKEPTQASLTSLSAEPPKETGNVFVTEKEVPMVVPDDSSQSLVLQENEPSVTVTSDSSPIMQETTSLKEAAQKSFEEVNQKLKEVAAQPVPPYTKKKLRLVNAESMQKWFSLKTISSMKTFLSNCNDKTLLSNILTLEKRIICRNLILQRLQEIEEEEGHAKRKSM